MPRTFLRPVYDFRDLADKGFRLRPMHQFRVGWQLFRRRPLRFMAYTLLVLGILTVLSVPMSMLYRHGMSAVSLLISLGIFVMLSPLMVGYFIVGKKIMYEEHYTAETFFSGFQFTVHILKAAFLMGLAAHIPLLLATALHFFGVLQMKFSWALELIGLAASAVLSASLVLSFLFIVFSGMPTGRSVKVSFMLVRRRLGSFLGFLGLWFLCNICGLLFFGVGLLVSVPVSHLALFAAFKSLIDQNRELSRGRRSRDLRFYEEEDEYS